MKEVKEFNGLKEYYEYRRRRWERRRSVYLACAQNARTRAERARWRESFVAMGVLGFKTPELRKQAARLESRQRLESVKMDALAQAFEMLAKSAEWHIECCDSVNAAVAK